MDLLSLQKYMFTLDNVNNYSIKKTDLSVVLKPEAIVQKERNEELFVPRRKDTLFWCFYIIKYGFSQYFLIGNQSFKIEKEIKIKHIEILRKSRDLIKKHKWKKRFLEDDLLNNKIISLKTFECLCILNNLHVTIINNKFFYSIISPNKLYFILEQGGEYGIYKGPMHEKQNEIKNLWQIENLYKPLKGVSTFKVKEIKEICKKIGIDIYINDKRYKTKKELYNLIKNKLSSCQLD